MPNRNGTGPNGQGTRTGRGLGNCSGQGGSGSGTGRGMERGGGRGKGGRRLGSSTSQGNSWIGTQLDNLQTAIERLTERLDKINKE
jgi:hypothetical protein